MKIHKDRDFTVPDLHYRDFKIPLPKKNHQSDFLSPDWWYQRDDWKQILSSEYIRRHKLWWSSIQDHIVDIYTATVYFENDEEDVNRMKKYKIFSPRKTIAVMKVMIKKNMMGYEDESGTPQYSEYRLSVPPYSPYFKTIQLKNKGEKI